MADNAMDRIKHLVVVMMENRSFDNLVRGRRGRSHSSCRTMTRGRNSATSAFKFSGRKTGVGHG